MTQSDSLAPAWSPRRYAHLTHPRAGETVLYLVRHGQTAANQRRVLQGSSDHPLDDVGLRQAALIAERLSTLPPVDAIVSSPLRRALVTATIIGERLGLSPATMPALTELDFGAGEDRTFDEMAAEHPALAARFLDPDDCDVCWPGGETRRQFTERVDRAFTRILDEHHGQRVIVVAHGGVIGAFLARVQGASPFDLAQYDIKNCSLSELHVTSDHTVLQLRNDVCHLEQVLETWDAAERER